jgi:hypothetical protein
MRKIYYFRPEIQFDIGKHDKHSKKCVYEQMIGNFTFI